MMRSLDPLKNPDTAWHPLSVGARAFTSAPLLLLLLLSGVTGCLHGPPPERAAEDPELNQLNVALQSAMTQGDMNRASGKIAEFWDARLAEVEQRCAEGLPGEQKMRFAESQAAWRQYRAEQVESRSEIYSGGSIRPLIRNQIYAELTEHRVKELESPGVRAQEKQ